MLLDCYGSYGGVRVAWFFDAVVNGNGLLVWITVIVFVGALSAL